jgi:putative ABC transport system permease protein
MLLMFFNVPAVFEGFSLYYLVTGLLLSVSIFLFAGYHGCKDALKLEPAEAMRPPAPPFSGKSLLERVGFFWGMLTIQGMMAVRNLSRNLGRSFFLFLGITISCAVVAMTWSLNDMVDKLVFYQFEKVETYDAKLTLSLPAERKAVARELEGLPEVTRAEPMLEVPVALSHKWLAEDVLLLGINADSTFYNILDKRSNRIDPAKDGLILSERLALKLDVQQGDSLDIRSPLFRLAKNQQVEVVEIIPQYLGMNAYMELSALEELLRQGKLATSFFVGVRGDTDEAVGQSISTLRDRYRESDLVAGVDGREERFRQTRELMETFGSAIYLYVFIGVITGFSIIYSSSFIILSERSRELASMMVLGMTPREVFSVITFEQWFISFFAILAGIPLAQMMQWGMAMEMSTDMYTIPGELSLPSLFVAPLITGLSIWLAQRFVLSKIEKLSLIDVLKTRE